MRAPLDHGLHWAPSRLHSPAPPKPGVGRTSIPCIPKRKALLGLALAVLGLSSSCQPHQAGPPNGIRSVPAAAQPTWSPERRAARELPVCREPIYQGPVEPPFLTSGVRQVSSSSCLGDVFIDVVIAASGRVEQTSVRRGLDQKCSAQALELVHSRTYRPAVWHGAPVYYDNCCFLPGDPVAVHLLTVVTFAHRVSGST